MKNFLFSLLLLLLAQQQIMAQITRRCALDIGSGELKMHIADVDNTRNQIVKNVASATKPVPLANIFLQHGDITPEIQNLTKRSFKELLTEARDLGAVEFAGIATAVFRNAPSGSRFLKELMEEGQELTNQPINLQIVTQTIEGETGYLTAIVLSPEFPKESIVSWDSGNSSFQIVTNNNNNKLEIFEGKFGTAIVAQDFVEKIRKESYQAGNPINPISQHEVISLVEYLIKSFDFPISLKNKIELPTTKVVGIGGQTCIFALGARALGKDSFTLKELYDILNSYSSQLLDNDSQELLILDPSYPSTTLVRLILLYAIMKALNIQKVIYKQSTGSTPGVLLSPSFFIKK